MIFTVAGTLLFFGEGIIILFFLTCESFGRRKKALPVIYFLSEMSESDLDLGQFMRVIALVSL